MLHLTVFLHCTYKTHCRVEHTSENWWKCKNKQQKTQLYDLFSRTNYSLIFLAVHGHKCTYMQHGWYLLPILVGRVVFSPIFLIKIKQPCFHSTYVCGYTCIIGIHVYTNTHTRKSKYQVKFQNYFLIAVLNCNDFVNAQFCWERKSLEKFLNKFSENVELCKKN